MVGKLLVACCTNCVVAIWVVDVPAPAVGAVGVPVNAGLAFSPCTKAVVAILVLESPAPAVVAVGVPVNTGLAF